MGSTPVEQSRMVMAMTAAELCTRQVIKVPMARNKRILIWLLVSNEEKKLIAAGLCDRSSLLPASLSNTSEKKRKAIPKRKSPKYLLFLLNINKMPKKKAG